MPVWIHNIETLVPGTVYSQEYAGEKMQDFFEDLRTKRLIRAIYKKSGIEKRHSVVNDFLGNGPGSFFKNGAEGKTVEPSTAERNEIYSREARALSVELARNAIDACPAFGPEDITHVVTASCTGFNNPGPDFHIVNELGLPPSVFRYHLGFMGCYAGITAMRTAAQFCLAEPTAVALVLCLELCTLHLQLRKEEDSLMANSLFADGAGAAIVSARDPGNNARHFRFDSFSSALVPDGAADMTWTIGDHGFDMTLSGYVPRIIGENIRGLIEPALAKSGLTVEDVSTWAVHPGGKAIVDKVQKCLSLHPDQVRSSREILRQYGNMSSGTILFVLQDILRHPSDPTGETVCAVAFGPGLTIEVALLQASQKDLQVP